MIIKHLIKLVININISIVCLFFLFVCFFVVFVYKLVFRLD